MHHGTGKSDDQASSSNQTIMRVSFGMESLFGGPTSQHCILSEDISTTALASGRRFSVDTFGKGVSGTASDGTPIIFPSIGAWMQFEAAWQSGYLDLTPLNAHVVGSNQVIDVGVWVPAALGSVGTGSYKVMHYHYDFSNGFGDVIIDGPLPQIPFNSPLWMQVGMDIGSIDLFVEGLSRDSNAQPYKPDKGKQWSWMISSITLGSPNGGVLPIEIVRSDTLAHVTVYMSLVSHFFYWNPQCSGEASWSLSRVIAITSLSKK
ncbi:MAG: hypothetical protein Q6353_020655 [Candidatus Sigynarchaeum springense]